MKRTNECACILILTGLCTAAAQIVFIREYLPVFEGNELIIGLALAIWLIAGAAGSLFGSGIRWWNKDVFLLLVLVSVIVGIVTIRAIRLFHLPGEVIPPIMIPFYMVLAKAPCAFLGGVAFGHIGTFVRGPLVYRLENTGTIIGLLVVSLLIIFNVPHVYIISFTLIPLLVFLITRPFMVIGAIIILGAFFITDPITSRWKYGSSVEFVRYGHQGEIAFTSHGTDSVFFLNNIVYRTSGSQPSVEQTVHLPMSLHPSPNHVLVVNNGGHRQECEKYENVKIECLEPEPLLAGLGCRCIPPELLVTEEKFDVVIMGTGVPVNAATSRFYSQTFFERMHSFMADTSFLAFTLHLNSHYLSQHERRLRDAILTTLKTVFRHITIFPGEGYTFVASDTHISHTIKPKVATDFFGPYILPTLTKYNMERANERVKTTILNTATQPVALYIAIERWMDTHRISNYTIGFIVLVLLLVFLYLLPKKHTILSVGSTGFVTGVYSVALLLVYQASYGTLYSRISILLIALVFGFAGGSFLRRIPCSDMLIGIYSLGSLILLANLPYPPFWLFLVFHGGIGVLAGAQFVTRKNTGWGALNAADLLGGVVGMGICSVFAISLYGVITVAYGLVALKMIVQCMGALKGNGNNGTNVPPYASVPE